MQLRLCDKNTDWVCVSVKNVNVCGFVSYQQFGEIEDCQMEDSSLSAVITFRTRAEAEQVHTL